MEQLSLVEVGFEMNTDKDKKGDKVYDERRENCEKYN